MGKAVKKVFGGGGSKSETTKQQSSQSNWLASNPQYQALVNKTIAESNNFNMPQYQLANMSEGEQANLASMIKGQDYSSLSNAASYLQGIGKTSISQGQTGLANAQSSLNGLQNMTTEEYNNYLKGFYNSDLVNSQIKQLSETVNQQEGKDILNLNIGASQAGGMGSSRAGVAQGVIAGKAQQAIASGTVQFQTAQQQQAQSFLANYLNTRQNAAATNAQIAQSQLNYGTSAYGTGTNYYTQYLAGNRQNQQDAINAAQIQRQYQQQQLDIQRANNILQQTGSQQRLMYVNQALAPIAGYASTSNGVQTTTTAGGGNSLLGGLMGAGGSMLGGTYLQGVGGLTQGQGQQIGGMLGGVFGNNVASL
ncbi:hypothetical protein JXH92_003676 [Salmonella enterica subsp. enterica serovar 4,[5],12:b:-]|nr:hypothetical protein [Salmonella enterica subsp. enterica serovar 4,[5],12:b:-]